MNLTDIWPYELRKGAGDHPSNGACIMDAVSWFATGKLGDHPECASPVLTEFAIVGNDRMSDDLRQKLKPFIFRLMGSRDDAAEDARLRCMVLAAARRFAPLTLEVAGLKEEAAKLRAIPDDASFEDIRSSAIAAGAAAWDAGAAAWDARAAARAAAGDAARGARAAAGDAGGDAGAAARAAAWDAYIECLDEALNLGAQGAMDFDPAPRVRDFEKERVSA